MGRLHPYGVTAWSWVNCLGKSSWCVDDEQPTFSLTTALQVDRLLSHEETLGIPGKSARADDPPALPESIRKHDSRCARLLLQAVEPLRRTIEDAVRRVGAERVGLVLGSSTGGIDATEAALRHERSAGSLPSGYDFVEIHPYHALLHVIEGVFGVRGPALVVSTACSSTGKALASAQRVIQAGLADVIIAGGADALCEMTVRGFSGLGVLSDEACRPFDAKRSGISIGEGAALIVLDREANTPFYFLGSGESSDAHHPTAPHPEGLGAQLAIERCLRACDMKPEAVTYLNAHGTGTLKNDEMEALAISRTLGKAVAFSSTKHRTGHQLGAAGGTEAAFCLQALAEGTMPAGYVPENIDVRLACQPMDRPLRLGAGSVTLSSSFAFGGSNVAVALGAARPASTLASALAETFWIQSVSLWTPEYPNVESFLAGKPAQDHLPPAELLSVRTRGRASMLTRTFAELFQQLAEKSAIDRSTVPTVYSSMYGEMTTTLALLDQLALEPRLSPIRFQGSVHNTASGQISLATQNHEFSTAIAAGTASFAMALVEAQCWLSAHGGDIFVLIADEHVPTRLSHRPAFAPMGVGLHLTSTPTSALGTLGWVSPAETRQGPELWDDSPRASSFAPLAASPPAWGLALIDALACGANGDFPVGPRSQVRLVSDARK